MAKTKTSTEEIIEKKESTPVASASLVLSFVAILAAIVFCLVEITDYRTGLSASVADSPIPPGTNTATRDLAAQELKVNRILNNQASPEDDADFDEDDADLDEDDADLNEDDADFDEEEEEDEDF